MTSHQHSNIIAQNYDLYEEYVRVPASARSLVIAKNILDRSYGDDYGFAKDDEVVELTLRAHKSSVASLYKVNEYSSVVVRNATAGFDIYLIDEDNLFVDVVTGVPFDEVVNTYNVLSLRSALFSNGYVFHEDDTISHGFYEASVNYDDAQLLNVANELEKIHTKNASVPIYDIVRIVGAIISRESFNQALYVNAVKNYSDVISDVVDIFKP